MEDRLSWLIIGAGAIGTYIGGSLILYGQKVVFLEQSIASTEISERGLLLNLHGQEHRILHPEIFSSIPEVLNYSSYDVVVFALKAYDTQSVLEQIKPYSSEFPPILCLQNGVENESTLASVLGTGRVIGGTLTSAISRRGAGDILLERSRGIGIEAGHPLSPRIQANFSRSGLKARLYASQGAMKWSKMLTNLMANASSAILDMTPAEILSHPDLYAVEITQLREAIQVCRQQGIRIVDLPGTPVKIFTWLVSNLPAKFSQIFLSQIAGKGRGQKMPSFHIDLHSGRGKSEVDFLNGAVVRFGKRLSIPTPVNTWLNQTLMKLTEGLIPLDEYKRQPVKYLEKIAAFKIENRE